MKPRDFIGAATCRAEPGNRKKAMLAARLAITPVALLSCVCLAAVAGEEPADPAAPQTAAEAGPSAEETAEFKPPPGFRPKKRGELTVYCRREAVLGSRFKAERCYDQAGIEELQRAELENAEMLERIRNCAVGSCNAG
jgi:hypothetical protein